MKSMADRAGFNPARGQIMKGGGSFFADISFHKGQKRRSQDTKRYSSDITSSLLRPGQSAFHESGNQND
jgi:hypothetical protein